MSGVEIIPIFLGVIVILGLAGPVGAAIFDRHRDNKLARICEKKRSWHREHWAGHQLDYRIKTRRRRHHYNYHDDNIYSDSY